MDDERGFDSRFFSARDGLKLHVRDYPANGANGLPVVCLPGLARTAADFHELALALAGDAKHPRRVLALDYRGRGLSEYDRNWRNYDLRVELDDLMQVLSATGVTEAVFIGTSRGGLLTMALAAARPAAIRGAVLNDVGPVIDAKGLIRIRGYIGKLPTPRDFDEGVDILRRLLDAQFPKLTAAQWHTMARRTWRRVDGRLTPAYDPALMKTLEILDLEAPLPALWFLFDGLKDVPVLVLRGANSDLLSEATLEAMKGRHPHLEAVVVPDQGHAPLTSDTEMINRIRRFVGHVERT
ncbi:alpha/beta hydrolase [Chelatococcus sp. SYSU_G07232]|uniref:Alpha/beta hydrolase n=1 Tax=Chelatococcus albus TaxID=3047466 RepID=A0ABT7AJV6_9HYPH|nr:alpha/beta hydrolase [Chelatococcus sp. SYSU_G07232]MDJ1159663.1 alpha/beta hydrolase [Chelatococcus sp. SYSU_G07232]